MFLILSQKENIEKNIINIWLKLLVLYAVTEILENTVLVANISNLVVYFHSNMNYTIPESSNMLTNFTGTCLLLTLFSGFIADSFLKRFWCIILFGILELLVIYIIIFIYLFLFLFCSFYL